MPSIYSQYREVEAQIKALEELKKSLRDEIISDISRRGIDLGKQVTLRENSVNWTLTSVTTRRYNQANGVPALEQSIKKARGNTKELLRGLFVPHIDSKKYEDLKQHNRVPKALEEAFEDYRVSERLTWKEEK